MTVEADRDDLLAAVRRVVDVVSSRNTIPVLANLLVRATAGTLTITGTDLDLQASASLDADGEIDTTVDAQKMLAAINGLGPGKLVIAPVAGRSAITIKRARGVRTLATLAATDFPLREPLEAQARFTIPATVLARLLDTTSIAHGSDDRAYLAGAYIHPKNGKLRAVATDGHKGLVCETVLPDGAEALPGIIVSTKATGFIRKILTRLDADIEFGATTTAFEIKARNVRLIGKLIEGTYPDYERIFPPVSAHTIVGARDCILDPAASVAAVVNAEGERKVRAVAFDLRASGEHDISTRDSIGTSATEALDCEYEGAGIRFGVDARYLAAVGGVFAESGKLSISIADPSKPMRITGDKDPDLLAVIGSWAV